MSSQSNVVSELSNSYDRVNQQLNTLQAILAKVTAVPLQQYEQAPDKNQLLRLHTHLMFALQSLAFMLEGTNSRELPKEFDKVKEYYHKVQNFINGAEPKKQAKSKVNKQAAQRVIKHTL